MTDLRHASCTSTWAPRELFDLRTHASVAGDHGNAVGRLDSVRNGFGNGLVMLVATEFSTHLMSENLATGGVTG